ncbi:hypothetical protein ACFPK1_09350 [Actinomycetospora rhizophila]|uniref:MFS transporter n=1 Tax=Actinomycetospora rhizophila TaxID=1416876 RepID=A0ABV9ZG67_9PSEU
MLALGTGPLFTRGIGAIVGAVPPSRAGAAASLAETGNYLGGALGLALLGTLAAASYRGAMRGVDGAARETVSGAAAAARALPAPQAGELLAAAHEAFTGSVHLVGVVAATLFALLAVATSRITLDA